MGKKKSAAERSVESAPRAGTGKDDRAGPRSRGTVSTTAADADRDVCGTCGHLHPGCRAHTKHGPNTGKPCGAQVRLGSLLCPKHGGNNPHHKEKARERMQDMVVPFLSELRKIVLDPDTEPSVKVRGIQVLLDRTGYGPNSTVTVQDSRWDALLGDAVVEVDRSLDGPAVTRALPSPGGGDEAWEDMHQHGVDEQKRQWAELDAEDEQPYTTRLDRFGPNVVKGEVVDNDSTGPFPPPPTTGPSEYDG